MIDVQVWCRSGEDHHGNWITGFLVWRGKLPSPPRADDYVVVFDGWSSERVIDAHFDLENSVVLVHIDPDRTGEYRAELERRKREREGGDA